MRCLIHTANYTVRTSYFDLRRLGKIKQIVKFEVEDRVDNQVYRGEGLLSKDFWLPCGPICYKIMLEKKSEHLEYIKKVNSPVFPKIHDIVSTDIATLIKCENVEQEVTTNDHITACIEEINRLQLAPEDEWCKFQESEGLSNIIGPKIVDFQRFKHLPSRYEFPTNVTTEELDKVYKEALVKYQARGDNKWKGRIYQGMKFSNGYVMPGYSSDGKIFDSYRKSTLCYFNKCKNQNVLDMGCNEGFYSLQAALHGAKRVDSFDLCEEDIWLAKNIYSRTDLPQDKIHYNVGNIVDWVIRDCPRYYNIAFLLSVLHQIFPNFEGSDSFLFMLSKKCNYLVFETPINHPCMQTSNLKEIRTRLERHFKNVRFLYKYKAYSKGDRAIYICSNNLPMIRLK